jgi:peptidoglycan/xylan/chitin deacetylase (PgdA/CDA1 family)
MSGAPHRLALSVDVEEWYHSGRWVDGAQAKALPDTAGLVRSLYGSERPAGDIIGPTRTLLELFARSGVRCTFFVLGEVARFHPELVAEIAARGHEIACHAMHHVDMTVLGPERFAEQLAASAELLRTITGRSPVGFRAPNLVYAPWATRILEAQGFLYDSSVCASRPLGGKYEGWSKAPSHPYRPSYEDIAELGGARLVEVPLPAFPVLKLAAGSSIVTRIFGLHWTLTALRAAIARGDTAYYMHPWEIGPRPPRPGSRLRNALFLRRTGPWMLSAVERILDRYAGRIVTVREAAEACGAPDWAYRLTPPSGVQAAERSAS